ncbi:K02A2.6-like [Cordylochernes scorpioides]|uniref:K02A2.6-like n=1 Tax=Cordylochernes scorpioides TaxID=51811 RepID=A0ABY6K3C3_9ARAC|nr:K02A2.6-like [Cordylochernes scorpioides]
MNGIRHTKTSPYNPSTNGLAERYVREFKNLLRKNNGKDDLETNLQSFLFAHRAFPQTVIKEFPGGTAIEEKFKIKILEFNTKMRNPREVFHEAVRRQEQFTTGPVAVHVPSCTPKPEAAAVQVPVRSPRPQRARKPLPDWGIIKGGDVLLSVYGEGCMSIQMVRRWRSWFLEGRQNVHYDERSGRPVTATDNAAVAAVRNVVEADRRVTIDEIIIRLPPGIEIGRSSIGTIMSDVLNFR